MTDPEKLPYLSLDDMDRLGCKVVPGWFGDQERTDWIRYDFGEELASVERFAGAPDPLPPMYSVAQHTAAVAEISQRIEWKPNPDTIDRDKIEFDSLCDMEAKLLPAQRKVLDQLRAWMDDAKMDAMFGTGTGEVKTAPRWPAWPLYTTGLAAKRLADYETRAIAALLASPEPMTIHTTLGAMAKSRDGVFHIDFETYGLRGNKAHSIIVDDYHCADGSTLNWDMIPEWPSDLTITSTPGLGKTEAMRRAIEAMEKKPFVAEAQPINNRAARRRAGRKERPCRTQRPPSARA